jgi:hypothetical protein
MRDEEDQARREEGGAQAGAGAGGHGPGGEADRIQDPQEAEIQERPAGRAGGIDRRALLRGCFPFFAPGERTLSGILFDRIRRGEGTRRYVLIHGNESTAREVLLEHIDRRSGIAHLVRGRTRNVLIDRWWIDPNRMFSREGAAVSLARWNYAYPARVLDYLDRERPKMVRALFPPAGGLMVALHNNSEGYSVRDEVAISDETSVKRAESPHNFFLTTNPKDYALLAAGPYNAVLQHRAPKVDDGSLSRLAARTGVRYVNLEVALGQKQTQARMLEWMEGALP